MREWDLFSVVAQFAFAVAIYFVCALAAPEATGEGVIDMEAFYWRNRRPFYFTLLVCLLLSLVVNAEFLKTPNAALFVEENAMVLPMIVAIGIPLALPARWAQWLGGIGLFLLVAGFTIVFSSTLH